MPSPRQALLSSRTWVRYALALAASLLAFAAARVSLNPASLFIPALAAMIFSAAWAGPGPGLLAALLCSAWIGFELPGLGRSLTAAIVSAALFAAEGVLLSIGSARILRFGREAAGNEARHQRLLETASEGIWTQNADGLITYANARMAEMLGVPVDRLPGRRVEEFYFPSDLSVERIRTESLISGLKQQFDRRLRRSDGKEIWVLACCNAIEADDSGTTPAVLAMMTDITERKRAEQALRRSEQRYRDLFDAVIEGVYQTTPDGHITAANPTLLKMLGFDRETDLVGSGFFDISASPAFRRKLFDLLEREGSLRNVESELRTVTGETRHVLENARVLRDENGETAGFEGTITDITTRKRVEEQLREAQKVEALGRLASGVARDFNTVLTLITNHIESALNELESSHPARLQTEQALEAAKNGEALTRQLLSFSRRPTGAEVPAVPETEVQSELQFASEGGETILLVEHDPLVRELSRDMLERQGYRVVLAAEASDAERIGVASHFDLLIADLRMEPITGDELARRLRAANPALRVLFVAGYQDPRAEAPQLILPNTGFISKPFSADSLGRRIRQVLAEK